MITAECIHPTVMSVTGRPTFQHIRQCQGRFL